MTASEPAGKPSTFKGTIDMVARIVTPRIMANPLIVGMHVGSVSMSGLIDKSPVSLCSWLLGARRLLDPRGLLGARSFLHPCRRLATLLNSGRRRTVSWNVSRAGCAIAATTLPAIPALRQSRDHRYRHDEEKSN